MTKQQKVARKAVKTRNARNLFKQQFGRQTYEVVFALRLGVDDATIREHTHISAGSLAAVKANLSRGTYDVCLSGCNF